MWEKVTSEWMEGKSFVIPAPQNCIAPPDKPEWNIELLATLLVERELIPASIEFDAQLYALLIVQMELQLLQNLVVPKGVGMGNFYKDVETRGLRIGAVKEEKHKCKKELEKWTGINIDSWYKIKIVEKKRKHAEETYPQAAPTKKVSV
jgi:hypothetical protein